MQKIVISIGGSVLFSDNTDSLLVKKFLNLINKLKEEYKIFIVVGGGKTARKYIQIGRKLGLDEKNLDTIGIKITKLNAILLSKLIPFSNKKIPSTISQAKDIDRPVVLMGGTTPGHSTDMVGAKLAESVKPLRFIIATNVDGIYDKDPHKHKDAKKIKKITTKELIKKYGTSWNTAGKNMVIDGPALKLIDEAKINTFVVNGTNLHQLEKAIRGRPFNGTIIQIK